MGADNPTTTTTDQTKKPATPAAPSQPKATTQHDTDKAATTAVSDAQKAMTEKGSEAAYAALKKDYDSFVKSTGGNQAQDKAYWDEVTKALGPLLPKVSIAWGEEQAKTAGKPLDQTALQADQQSHNPFDATLATSLTSQVNGVKTETDGRIVTQFKDGTSQSLNPKDNSVVTSDAQGKTTAVHYADGTSRAFGYDPQSGALNQITETDGKVYKLQDGKWLGPDGADTHNTNPKVLKDGTYSYQTADGKTISTTSANVRSQINPDGSIVHLDSSNRPTEIDYKDGKKAQFGYDDQGHANKVVSADGSTVTLRDGKWLDAKGQDTGMSDVRVQADGSYWFQNKGIEHINSTADTQQQFDQKSIEKAAKDLHEAKDNTSWLGLKSDPDTNKIWNILEPMSSPQRQLVQEQYQKDHPDHTLLGDLRDKLSAPDYARAEAIMKRQDGVADNTGQIWQAVAKLHDMGPPDPGFTDDNRVRAEKEIRDSINTLTADQLKAVEAKYKQDYGQDLQSSLLNSPDLSDESKKALQVYFKGNDKITDADRLQLADMALKQNRPDIFDETFRDASQTARDKFVADGGMKKIDDAFDGADAQIAKDYVQRGTVSISTIVDGDTHWYHTNKDDIARAATNATPQDRQDFIRGEQLAQSKQTPTTDDDKRALAFYQNVDKAFHNAGNDREATEWEAKLRNNESVITGILDSHKDGSWFFNVGDGTDKNKELSAVEKMSPKDWQFLKDHPDEVAKIDKALGTFSDSHHDQVMSMLKAKLDAPDFAASQQVGNRGIEERLKDNDGNTGARVDALAAMSATERQEYANNTNGMRDKVNALLKSDEERVLADQLSKTQGNLTPVEKVLIDGLKNDNPNATFTDMEAAFKADPTLKDRMNNPQTKEDKDLSTYFHDATRGAVDKAGLGDKDYGDGGTIPGQYDQYDKGIFKDGHVPLDMQLSLTQDKDLRNSLIIHASDAERARLLDKNPDAATKQFQDTVFGDNKDVRQVLTYALQEKDPTTGQPGYLDQADQFKLFAAQGGGSSDQLKTMLEGMTPNQRQDLANEYFTKYGKLVTEDVIDKIPSDQQWRFRELLSPTDVNVRQVALDAQLSNDSHTSSWDDVMKSTWDYSRVSADSTQDNLTKFVAQHSAELDKLPPDQRKQFDDAVNNYMAAQKNYVDSKGQFAETFVDATITIAAVAGAAFSGGTSLALLGAIGAGGAVYRTAMMSSIEGSDFDGSAKNILKQSFEGGTAAALGFLGPEALGLKGLAVGEDVAAITAGKLVEGAGTQALFKEGSEEVLQQTLAGITRQGAIAGDKEIAALAEKVAADGVDKNLVEQAIKQQLKQDVMTGMKNVVKNEADAYVRNLVAAQVGVQGKELAATAVGFESPDTLLARMKGAAISTTAGVTLFHGVFRTAQVGGDYVKIALGQDGAGNFIAGGGTAVRHADGSMEVVPEGKTLVLGKGDTLPENLAAKKGAWGTALADGTGEVQHFEDATGKYTRVEGKPDTWRDGSGKEVTLTNVKVDSDGSLEYSKDGVNTKYDGKTGEVTHPGADPVQAPPAEAPRPVEAPERNLTPDELKAVLAKQQQEGQEFLLKQMVDTVKTNAGDPAVKSEIERERPILDQAKAAIEAGDTKEALKLLQELPQASNKDASWAAKGIDAAIPKAVADAGPEKVKEFLNAKLKVQTDKLDRWERAAGGDLGKLTSTQLEELQQSLKLAAAGKTDSPFNAISDNVKTAVDAYKAGEKDPQLQQFFGKIDPQGNYKLSVYDAITSSKPGEGSIGKEQLVEKLLKPHALDSLSAADREKAIPQLERARAEIAEALAGRPQINESELPSSWGDQPIDPKDANAPKNFSVGADNPQGRAEMLQALKDDPKLDPAKNPAVKAFLNGDSRMTDFRIVRNENGDTMLMRFDKSDSPNQSKAYVLVLKPDGKPAFTNPDGSAIPKLHLTFNVDPKNPDQPPLKDIKVEIKGDDKPTLYDRGGTDNPGLVNFDGSGFKNAQELIDYLNKMFEGIKYPGN